MKTLLLVPRVMLKDKARINTLLAEGFIIRVAR